MISTVTLETAKALKKAGFGNGTEFYWPDGGDLCTKEQYYDFLDWANSVGKPEGSSIQEHFSAPTTDELLEELPTNTHIYKTESGYSCSSFTNPRKASITFVGNSAPEVTAKMWLWLKKEGLIK